MLHRQRWYRYRLSICQSINHWTPNCPNNQSPNNTYYNKIVLYQTDYQRPSKLLPLVKESRNAAVLNSRASKTVCRESWFNIFQESLSYKEKHHIVFTKSDKDYKFGKGVQVTAVELQHPSP